MIYLSLAPCKSDVESQRQASHLLATNLLNALGFENASISKDEKGRPHTSVSADISISHCDDLCAVSAICSSSSNSDFDMTIPVDGDRIGIDIERVDESLNIERQKRIAQRFLNADITTAEEFYSLWTKKEAYGKMIGDGFFSDENIPCQSFTFFIEYNSKRYCLSICIK